MTEQDSSSMSSETTLRQRAESQFQKNVAATSEDVSRMSSEEIRTLLHNLRVHQIELEMQNEELRQTQIERDVAQARYVDLYDEAPVGYCTLSENGLLAQANLSVASLLGVVRAELLNKPISKFVLKEDQDAFYLLRKNTFISGLPQQTELRLLKGDRVHRHAKHFHTTALNRQWLHAWRLRFNLFGKDYSFEGMLKKDIAQIIENQA